MDKIILTIWITLTIVTIIPNIVYICRRINGRYEDLYDAGFMHYLCLFAFISSSILLLCNFVYLILP